MIGKKILFLCLVSVVVGSQLVTDPDNPFVAYGNGTTYDISMVFEYPVSITSK